MKIFLDTRYKVVEMFLLMKAGVFVLIDFGESRTHPGEFQEPLMKDSNDVIQVMSVYIVYSSLGNMNTNILFYKIKFTLKKKD